MSLIVGGKRHNNVAGIFRGSKKGLRNSRFGDLGFGILGFPFLAFESFWTGKEKWVRIV